jgi:epoxyqueuosine reductase
VVFADDNAIVDREAAWLGGLGWFGKNANLLLPGAGSWFVLGCVVTNARLPVSTPIADGCGPCRRCLDACPTQAIIAPGVVDARRCLAWLLQRPGIMERQYRVALGDRLYGCDDCQEVCPPTVRLGGGHPAQPVAKTTEVQAWVPVLDLLDLSDDDIMQRYGRWYIHRRDPRWLRRNALVVLGNIGSGAHHRTAATLARFLTPDADPMLMAHAIWAAARLGRRDLLATLAISDITDPDVVDELAQLDDIAVIS